MTIWVLAFVWGVSLLGCRTASGPSDVELVPVEMLAAPVDGTAILLEDLPAGALYPPGNWWSRDIRNAPVDPASGDLLQ